jgi:hypothetical protein
MLIPMFAEVLVARTEMMSVASPSPVTAAVASPANVPEGVQLVVVNQAPPVVPDHERVVCARETGLSAKTMEADRISGADTFFMDSGVIE